MTDLPGLFVRLYLDVNIHHWLAHDLRSRGFDAIHALDIGHDRLSDEQHLRWQPVTSEPSCRLTVATISESPPSGC
jgi:hypothetical protein